MTAVDTIDGGGGPNGRSHQEILAESLIQSLGTEGAIHACRANSWDGVLRYVLSLGGESSVAGI